MTCSSLSEYFISVKLSWTNFVILTLYNLWEGNKLGTAFINDPVWSDVRNKKPNFLQKLAQTEAKAKFNWTAQYF